MVRGIAYLIHTFPLWTSTFITDEVDILRRDGWTLRLFGVRPPREGEYPADSARFLRETTYVFPVSAPRLLTRHVRMALSRPIAYFRTLWGALTWGSLTTRNRLRTLIHFAEAVYLHSDLVRTGCRHLHVHFASGSATIALFLNELTALSYSLTAHGTDMFVERVLLPQKISHARFTRVGTRRNREYLAALVSDDAARTIHVIPFGVDLRRISPAAAPARHETTLRLLSVGRLVWQKGQATLLEACARLRDAGLDFRLTVVGEGQERHALEGLRQTLGLADLVDMPGAMTSTQVYEMYRQADLFVLSSVSEGFGLVVVEAMASELPVVTPALPGMDEIVSDGEDGRVYPPGSSQDLASIILELARDPDGRKRMGQRGAEKARRLFDNDVSVRRFAQLLGEVAASA